MADQKFSNLDLVKACDKCEHLFKLPDTTSILTLP